MSNVFSLIVTDTSPLFTLVLAGALDVLLRPGLGVSIPDAVYVEATRVRGAPGAEEIVAWINANLDAVRIVATDIGIDQQRRLEEGRSTRGLGEQAAIETLERFLRTHGSAEALLLFEDSDVGKRRAIVDERVGLTSTGDFLRELEMAGLIQSTRFILGQASARPQRRTAARGWGKCRDARTPARTASSSTRASRSGDLAAASNCVCRLTGNVARSKSGASDASSRRLRRSGRLFLAQSPQLLLQRLVVA